MKKKRLPQKVNLENDRDYLRIRFGLVPTTSHRTFHRVKNQKSSFHSKNFSSKEALQCVYREFSNLSLI